MKNKNYITKYLIIILPLLFINLNAQDQADPVEETTATEEVESTEAAAEATAEAEETESTEATAEEVAVTDEVEELVVKKKNLVLVLVLLQVLVLYLVRHSLAYPQAQQLSLLHLGDLS